MYSLLPFFGIRALYTPPPPVSAPEADPTTAADLYWHTQDTGNKVSRKSQIIGTQNIILGGKSVIQAEVIIRGDLVRTLDPTTASAAAPGDKKAPVVAVAIGRYCFLSRGCVLKPPGRAIKGCVHPTPHLSIHRCIASHS